MELTTGRISQRTFKVVNYVFFGIAISVAIARIIIRRWLQKQLRPDDYLLLLSSTCLISATAVLYYGTSSIFLAAELAFNPAAALQTGVDQAEMLRRIDLLLRITWAYLALSWATIFFVKFGFLWLFRHLVDRIPPMNRFWKVTLVFTGLLFAFALCEGFITCPKFGFESIQCSTNATWHTKALAMGITTILLDMLTDVFILAIPLILLWQVRLRPAQKLGLGAFLCLSVFMIFMAIIRVSGMLNHGVIDQPWTCMWQQIEACIAVTMLSLTAFRSVFVGAKPSLGQNKASPWVPSTRRLLGRHKKPRPGDQQRLDDLTIPSATLTGPSRAFNRTASGHSMDQSVTLNSGPPTPLLEHGPAPNTSRIFY